MEQQRWEESERRKEEGQISEKRKSQKKEDAGAGKGGKVAKRCVFPKFCGLGDRKVGWLKGVEPSGQMKMRDEKVHASIARSTPRS